MNLPRNRKELAAQILEGAQPHTGYEDATAAVDGSPLDGAPDVPTDASNGDLESLLGQIKTLLDQIGEIIAKRAEAGATESFRPRVSLANLREQLLSTSKKSKQNAYLDAITGK